MQPVEELGHGLGVGGARIFISDVGGEELDEAPSGLIAGRGNRCRQPVKTGTGRVGGRDWDNLRAHLRLALSESVTTIHGTASLNIF